MQDPRHPAGDALRAGTGTGGRIAADVAAAAAGDPPFPARPGNDRRGPDAPARVAARRSGALGGQSRRRHPRHQDTQALRGAGGRAHHGHAGHRRAFGRRPAAPAQGQEQGVRCHGRHRAPGQAPLRQGQPHAGHGRPHRHLRQRRRHGPVPGHRLRVPVQLHRLGRDRQPAGRRRRRPDAARQGCDHRGARQDVAPGQRRAMGLVNGRHEGAFELDGRPPPRPASTAHGHRGQPARQGDLPARRPDGPADQRAQEARCRLRRRQGVPVRGPAADDAGRDPVLRGARAAHRQARLVQTAEDGPRRAGCRGPLSGRACRRGAVGAARAGAGRPPQHVAVPVLRPASGAAANLGRADAVRRL